MINKPEIIKSKTVLVEGLNLCLQNAEELYEDAILLFKEQRYKRTVTLCIIALEELGKIVPIYDLGAENISEEKWRKFWKDFRSHSAKQIRSLSMKIVQKIDEGDLDRVKKWVRRDPAQKSTASLEETKQASLYVDYKNKDFQLYKFSETLAKELTEELAEQIHFYKEVKAKGLFSVDSLNDYQTMKKDPECMEDIRKKQKILNTLMEQTGA